MDDDKHFMQSKTIIFNLIMGLASAGVLTLPLDPQQLKEVIGAMVTLWTAVAGIIRFYTNKPVRLSVKPSGPTASVVLAALILPLFFLLGGCATDGSGVGTAIVAKPSTDTRIALAESLLASGNYWFQSQVQAGKIAPDKAQKAQAVIDAAALALAEARKALADQKLDAGDAITAAIDAATKIPAIIAEFKAK